MASTKAKQNGAGKKPKAPSPSTGTSTPVTTASTPVTSAQIELAVYGSGRPEKAAYDAEQNKIKAEIDVLQARLVRPPPPARAAAPARTPSLTRALATTERGQGQALWRARRARPGAEKTAARPARRDPRLAGQH